MGVRNAFVSIVNADRKALAPLASAGVLALIGNPPRLYPIEIPQAVLTTTLTSAVAYHAINNPSDKMLNGVSSLWHTRMQLTIWANKMSLASAIDHAFQDLLIGYTGTLADTYIDRIFHDDSRDDKEPETRYFKVYADYKILWRLT